MNQSVTNKSDFGSERHIVIHRPDLPGYLGIDLFLFVIYQPISFIQIIGDFIKRRTRIVKSDD